MCGAECLCAWRTATERADLPACCKAAERAEFARLDRIYLDALMPKSPTRDLQPETD